jgi:hypothetical protein
VWHRRPRIDVAVGGLAEEAAVGEAEHLRKLERSRYGIGARALCTRTAAFGLYECFDI